LVGIALTRHLPVPLVGPNLPAHIAHAGEQRLRTGDGGAIVLLGRVAEFDITWTTPDSVEEKR